ncbi:hypothetical protein BDW69DRAFT_99209 [Aspergillus filifer]
MGIRNEIVEREWKNGKDRKSQIFKHKIEEKDNKKRREEWKKISHKKGKPPDARYARYIKSSQSQLKSTNQEFINSSSSLF